MLWEKGVEEFVEAVRLLRKRGFSGRAMLVGGMDTGYPSSVPKKQLEEWDKVRVVEWLGHREDVAQLLQQAHIFVLPSYYGEGLPKALLEACAVGRPVISTDIPGCRDIIRDGYNGLLVSPKDPEALAEAIAKLLDDAPLRQRMGEAGRKTILKGFTSEEINRRTIEQYEGLLNKDSFQSSSRQRNS
jgi:glycosyltransferase involved in cell wall biosynthesis